jgi:hypothetical protein
MHADFNNGRWAFDVFRLAGDPQRSIVLLVTRLSAVALCVSGLLITSCELLPSYLLFESPTACDRSAVTDFDIGHWAFGVFRSCGSLVPSVASQHVVAYAKAGQKAYEQGPIHRE